MGLGLGAKIQGGAVAFVEEVPDQTYLYCCAAEKPRLVDLLLRRCHRHEHHALDAEMPADEGETLRVIAGRSADK